MKHCLGDGGSSIVSLAVSAKRDGTSTLSKNKKRARSGDRALYFEIIPAATYVPTQLPVQYHRPGEA